MVTSCSCFARRVNRFRKFRIHTKRPGKSLIPLWSATVHGVVFEIFVGANGVAGIEVRTEIVAWAKARLRRAHVFVEAKMAGTRRRSLGARSRDPLALPTLQDHAVIGRAGSPSSRDEPAQNKDPIAHVAGRPDAAAWHCAKEAKMQSIRSPSCSPNTCRQTGEPGA